ncbi:(Na+)-NQR maturation NqrM [Bowmanella sp. JS7-9]|uniref:(Na+)-NQR maturation NqrM n=1 Tax=Pseudobowmanella zhangzhouensis TaxID=1537679 RepID=A0ABW1XNP5_9ALTE|nr:(Na+)-NQR maturation NqrM [Bowmanella sp. JS7-9]TBX22028.1 hypothetical protein TK45_11150 [Bowmanella sp. JS7-9]
MSTFVLTFVAFVVVIVIMAVGYMIQRKSISGSCGGLGALGIEKACDCPEPCDRKKARLAREQARAAKLKEWQDNKII